MQEKEKKLCLVVIPFTDQQKEKIKRSSECYEFVFTDKKRVTKEQLQAAEIIMGNVSPELLTEAEHLRWLQLNSAGVNQYIPEGVLAEGVLLSSAVGAYDISVTEGMLAATMDLYRKMPAYMDSQKKHLWKDEGPILSPYGATVLIVGLGQIGCRYARIMKALGSYIIGIKRSLSEKPDYVDELYTMDHLHDCLSRADLVMSVLPATEATRHRYGEEEFSRMKDSAYFLNFGRGDAVVTDDLYQALCRGQIAGAALDVTDPEPLPADHILWDAPHLILTPHVAGAFHIPQTLEIIAEICCENMQHFERGEALRNQVTKSKGY